MFRGIFCPFLKSILNFPCSVEKRTLLAKSISEVIESERCAYINA